VEARASIASFNFFSKTIFFPNDVDSELKPAVSLARTSLEPC